MNNTVKNLTKITLFTCLFLSSISYGKINLLTSYGDYRYGFSGNFKPETFGANRSSLFNDNIKTDKLWFARHTLDTSFRAEYGLNTYDAIITELFFTVRNKAIWGNSESIAKTTSKEVKSVDVVDGEHSHAIPRHIFWIRELWLNMNLAHVFDLDIDDSHQFKVGAFPFQLGRGIALGDSFAVGPESIGFYSESVVDQYAFGALFEGDAIKNRLHYSLYSAILENKSSNLGDTGAKILGQEYGRLETPARGFGKINFVVASKLNWQVFDTAKWGKLNLEPYALFNHAPEQKIEFTGDASSKLGSFGLACEYVGDRCEFGFDYAFNIGRQYVKGWDRNTVQKENRNGYVIVVNSHVDDGNGAKAKKIPHVPGSEADKCIKAANKVQQSEKLNGKNIKQLVKGFDGTNGFENITPAPLTLHNKNNRFRDPYSNKYEGWMFVVDGSCWVYKKDLKLAATAAITTGDENPNLETIDGQFAGFIPLQETYSGKRVKSAFLLGGSGKLNRQLSVPTTEQAPSKFATVVSNFTDLVLCGAGLQWVPSNWTHKLDVRPNALLFWKEHRINKFDALTKKETLEKASNFLGSEFNIFADYYPLKDLKLFFVGSVFVPGTHFADILGKPLNSGEEKELDKLDQTGFDEGRIPNIGKDIAYTVNIGLNFSF